MVSADFQKELNTAYDCLEKKHNELYLALSHRMFVLETGWFNGHYQKQKDGGWRRDAYPIPVISVKGYCDIEIRFDRIDVSAKRKREEALAYSYDRLAEYSFEAYGVEEFLSDYYHEGQPITQLRERILQSTEKEIGFSFTFPFHTEGRRMFEFVKLLRKEGFYY